jgi:hypothetical protein
MRKIVAFYAWQSDTVEKSNRYLIGTALKDAAKRITASTPDLEVIIDSDTSGAPGTPPITDTLLKKIAECDIFIPDVSFVAHTAAGKYVPNPNVMLEYGYPACEDLYGNDAGDEHRVRTSATTTFRHGASSPSHSIPY